MKMKNGTTLIYIRARPLCLNISANGRYTRVELSDPMGGTPSPRRLANMDSKGEGA
jgi:hypothetical protein